MNKSFSQFLILFVFSLIVTQSVFARDNEYILLVDPVTQDPADGQSQGTMKLTPAQNFERTQAVYRAFGFPVEVDHSSELQDLNLTSSWSQLQAALPFFDPTKTFSRFMNLQNNNLSWYQDADAKNILDGVLNLKPMQQSDIRLFSEAQPLAGLRIALDPGHMGGKLWDVRLGKYVKDGKGRVLSEGVLNLQICLLLKKELESLGAVVFVTHEDLAAVSNEDYETYDLNRYGREEFFMSSQQDWFINTLTASDKPETIKKAFEQNSNFKALFAEKQRSEYYAKRIDVYARAEVIEKFHPDLTLIIHLDTAGDSFLVNPNSPNAAKAYVPGGYEKTEFANRELRSYFIRNWVGNDRWQKSVQLSRLLLKHLRENMSLELQKNDANHSVKIEDGLFARNLVIPRRMKTGAVAYMECLFYDRTAEFTALRDYKYQMTIGSQSYPYSDRLLQIVTSLRDGILEYTQH